jgi:hypothetical protein
MGDVLSIIDAIESRRLRHANERQLQDALAMVLDQVGLSYQREHRLSDEDVIDFLVEGCLGMEVKVGGSEAALLRQVARYAQHGAIARLLVVTTKPHQLPPTVCGKPITVLVLQGGLQ